ncbi:S8 family peptidase [Chenggangzhangella methanolivorans]|uniref:S8 family serine peptidase n=1 Tax=Chenggangzhangella methanolivorans TaxID=1437009 RepID=A0A9E6R6I2_9HYPH|nr:S8 family serine peptidase [Chenggangzhangella methanolivorans]QZN98301.1 S8 family serine peptidase [Chenggangzhangella methanolivorans]
MLDTGVALKHPMLEGKIVSQACYSTNEPAETATSICPGGDPEDTGENSGRACTSVPDGCEHGTHVASIAVGDGSRFDGVARGASLIPIQMFSRFTDCGGGPSPCISSYTTDQIKALERVFRLRNRFTIDVVNMSVSDGAHAASCDAVSPALKTAIDNLRSAGIATVISSGNGGLTGRIGFPACISSAIAVGSSTKKDVIAFTSNHSPLVKLLAPGDQIEAAVPPKAFAVLSGTSMAAPHVAGAFALMRDAQPEASVDDIVSALECSGKTLHQRDQGGGAAIGISPQLPRIDVLGARDWLRGKPNTKREWLFERADDAGDWAPVLQDWKVRRGSYMLDITGPGAAATEVANCSGSFTVEAAMRRVDPQVDRFASSGLFFKAKVNRATNAISGYFVSYNKCPTNDAGACTTDPEDKPGQLIVAKMVDFKFDGTGGSGASVCIRKAKVNVNKVNLLKVVTNGSSHRVFMNDVQVCAFEDATYSSGSIVLASFRNVPGSEFRVDEVKIRSNDKGPVESIGAMAEPDSYAPDLMAGSASLFGPDPVASMAAR